MAIDFKWMSNGGLLLDGSGDIALCTVDDGIRDMVRSRLKAALNGWKLYAIGADLEKHIGNGVDAEMEVSIRRQVTTSLTREFLPRGAFQVRTLATGPTIDIFVYINGDVVSSATVTRNGDQLQLQAVN